MLSIKTLTYVSTHTTLGGCSADVGQESDQYKSIKTNEVKVKLVLVELLVSQELGESAKQNLNFFKMCFLCKKGKSKELMTESSQEPACSCPDAHVLPTAVHLILLDVGFIAVH